VTFTEFEVAVPPVAVAVQVPVPSPFCDVMLKVPPVTPRFFVTVVDPLFTQEMVMVVILPE
jgi:hypothetical protein